MVCINIALVDDEPSALKIFELRLKKLIKDGSLKLFTFSNPLQLLDFLDEKQEEIEIILLFSDINMPEMNGLELLKLVKEKFPNIVVAMESAYGSDDYINEAKSLGANYYLTKPVDFNKVEEIVQEYREKLKAA